MTLKSVGKTINWGAVLTAIIVTFLTIFISSMKDISAMPRQIERQQIIKEAEESASNCYVRKDLYESEQKNIDKRLIEMNELLKIILKNVKRG